MNSNDLTFLPASFDKQDDLLNLENGVNQNRVVCIDWGQQVKMDKKINYIFKEFSYIFEDLFKEIR